MFLEDIDNDNKWREFLDYKESSNFLSKREKKILSNFINNNKYKLITSQIKAQNYIFTIPKKHVVSKSQSSKKRVVYSFNDDEMMVLKYIAYLLYQYDYLFTNNLYSFRKKVGVKNAIINLNNIKNIHKMYGYKVDIQNYFNSIKPKILLNDLKMTIDHDLFCFINTIIDNPMVIYNNQIINEHKGVMAGIPIASFLANYYIRTIDQYFENKKLVYLRYADDIIIFCNTENEIFKYANVLKKLLDKYYLNINKDKECFFKPGDSWEFLGFTFNDKTIDISSNTLYKIKCKIRRSARSIRRWMLKNNVDNNKALKVMIKKYNKKFYGHENTELSWKYWFFPVINTTKSLKIIDKYLQDNLRYIVTGKHNKKNYKIVPYELLQQLGYKSLIHEYYLFINMKSDM